MTTRRIPGTILASGFMLRVQASFNSQIKRVVREWNYGNSPNSVHTKVQQGASNEIFNIYKNDIVVTTSPEFEDDIGLQRDVYGDTTFNKMPVIGTYTGVPAWAGDLQYLGPKNQEKNAIADYLLQGVNFAGIMGGNYWGGGDHESPPQEGFPVDLMSMATIYVPFDGDISPMQPIKLDIDRKDMSDRADGAQFTVAPIKSQPIATQMMNSAVAYANALVDKDPSRKGLLSFFNVNNEMRVRGSCIMRNDVQIGHKLMLGQIGVFLNMYRIFNELYGGTAEDSERLKDRVARAFFAESYELEDLKTASQFFKRVAETPRNQIYGDALIDNIIRDGLHNSCQATAEQVIRNNACIGKMIREQAVATPEGRRRKIDGFFSI